LIGGILSSIDILLRKAMLVFQMLCKLKLGESRKRLLLTRTEPTLKNAMEVLDMLN
jgi:hypothetical protein